MVEAPGRRTHRRHSADFKVKVVQACRKSGVSIASVALANGLNANMLRRWVVEAEHGGAVALSSQGSQANVALPLCLIPTGGAAGFGRPWGAQWP